MSTSVNIPSKHRPFLARKAAERQCSQEEYVALLLEEDEAMDRIDDDVSQDEVGVAWASEIRARRQRLRSGDAHTVSRTALEDSISRRLSE